MEITSNSGLTSNNTTSNSQNNSLISSDFETFLKMLTAQAKYQDPLEPIDNAEYASQLAQFSGVEQQVQTNDLLNSVLSTLATSNLAEFASWIGMDARSSAPVKFEGTPVALTSKAQTGAQESTLVVYDDAQKEVQRIAVDVSATSYEWAGVRDDGTAFPAGTYSFKLESSANGEVLGTGDVQSYSKVDEARVDNGKAVLVLETGTEIEPGDVTALR